MGAFLDVVKGLIQTRGAQLVSRYAGVGLVFLAGKVGVTFASDQLASVSSGLSMLLVGAILFAIDHYSHSNQNPTV